jgi:hypothetical protein
MKRKFLRSIYGMLSLSSALFVFQACYGMPQDMGNDVLIQGTVKSKANNQPIAGIKVMIANMPQFEITDNEGKFTIYTSVESEYKVKFEDTDPAKDGSFQSKDTVLRTTDRSISLNISLDAK